MKKYSIPIVIALSIALVATFLIVSTPTARKVPFPADLASCDMLLFTTQSCHYCKAARRLLNKPEITINWCEIDTQQTKEGYALFREIGGQGVPVAIIGNERIDGYSQVSYEKAIKKYQANL
jgi:glutaredoxin